jgi:hypothetical protein
VASSEGSDGSPPRAAAVAESWGPRSIRPHVERKGVSCNGTAVAFPCVEGA